MDRVQCRGPGKVEGDPLEQDGWYREIVVVVGGIINESIRPQSEGYEGISDED